LCLCGDNFSLLCNLTTAVFQTTEQDLVGPLFSTKIQPLSGCLRTFSSFA
jgi:hypothetical protein